MNCKKRFHVLPPFFLSALLACWLVPTGQAQSQTFTIQAIAPRFGLLSNWNPALTPNVNIFFNNPDFRSGLTVTIVNKSASSTAGFNLALQQSSDSLDPSLSIFYANVACTRLNFGTSVFKSNYPAFSAFSGESLSFLDINVYNCPVTGALRYKLILTTGTGTGPVDIIGSVNPGTAWQTGTLQAAGSPCDNPNNPKSSVVVNISAAGTSGLVNLSGTQIIYVCGGTVVAGAGTNPSFQLEYGTTNGTCAGGTTTLTGAMATGVTVSTTVPGEILTLPQMKTASGNALCAVAGGTTPNFQGVITFIQQ